ncbi:hypothetical protein AAFF_G00212940 [Aldrovandia affinis]|uniref:Uncharacterized protein n=1 Tax=Aldrovandia affinis TaxID=143900 RepID=A0AAD7W5A9_9TELE|nr:hypothetical protein AAFF_G00212940 [Aldrovandia affinis]
MGAVVQVKTGSILTGGVRASQSSRITRQTRISSESLHRLLQNSEKTLMGVQVLLLVFTAAMAAFRGAHCQQSD